MRCRRVRLGRPADGLSRVGRQARSGGRGSVVSVP